MAGMSNWFYFPVWVFVLNVAPSGGLLLLFLLCAAQSALLTWLLFRRRARRVARLRSEAEAAKVGP